jgi:hypothetical protein
MLYSLPQEYVRSVLNGCPSRCTCTCFNSNISAAFPTPRAVPRKARFSNSVYAVLTADATADVTKVKEMRFLNFEVSEF